MTYLECSICGAVFEREVGIHEAELAWYNGEELGDYVCPECHADDSAIEEVLA